MTIDHALSFLDMLDCGGRHTIASEAPFGSKDGGPLWERGQTYEREQRDKLIRDIETRQARGSNVYYSVNRPCPRNERVGANGKNNTDDIVAIRALAFDIDVTKRPFDVTSLRDFIDSTLTGVLRPSLLISTGGGFHLIYLLESVLPMELFRPPANDEQKERNEKLIGMRQRVTTLAHDFEFWLRTLVPPELNEHIKIDNMSNVDLMRLPGTVNYPKEEKRAKGQVEALAHIAVDYQCRTNIKALRDQIPGSENKHEVRYRHHTDRASKNGWTSYLMAKYLCEKIREAEIADNNEIYTHWVVFPLIGMIHDEHALTFEQAEECFMEAIAGGRRYGDPGRGYAYFLRQWRSHRPELRRPGTKSLGSLILFCQHFDIDIPWLPKATIVTENDPPAYTVVVDDKYRNGLADIAS